MIKITSDVCSRELAHGSRTSVSSVFNSTRTRTACAFVCHNYIIQARRYLEYRTHDVIQLINIYICISSFFSSPRWNRSSCCVLSILFFFFCQYIICQRISVEKNQITSSLRKSEIHFFKFWQFYTDSSKPRKKFVFFFLSYCLHTDLKRYSKPSCII